MNWIARQRLLVVALVLAAVGVMAAVGSRFLGGDAGAGPELQVATNDDEWLRLIEEARRLMADTSAPWPESAVPPGITVLRSCAAIPAGATNSGMAIEYSPDDTRKRVVVDYFEPPDGRYRLILYPDSDMSGCPNALKAIVTGPDQYKQAVNAHLCEQMTLMAAGSPPTDKTLRPASPAVARAYLHAFCP